MPFSVHAAFIIPFLAPWSRARKTTVPRLRRVILGFSFSPCVSPRVDGSVHVGPPSRSSERQREVLCGDEGVGKQHRCKEVGLSAVDSSCCLPSAQKRPPPSEMLIKALRTSYPSPDPTVPTRKSPCFPPGLVEEYPECSSASCGLLTRHQRNSIFCLIIWFS